MASTPAPLPSLGLLDGLGTAVSTPVDSPAYLPSIGLLGGLGSSGATYTLVAEHGAFSFTGSNALRDFAITAEPGVFSFTGQDATLTPGSSAPTYTLVAEHGTFSFAGQAAGSSRTYRLNAEPGVFRFYGQAATLNYSGAPPVKAASSGGWTGPAGRTRNYIVKGKKYYDLTPLQLAVLLATDAADAQRQEVKVALRKNKAKPVAKAEWQTLQAAIKSLDIESDDDEEAAMLLL